MSDLRVSQLPTITSAAPTDRIIVNAGNPQETKTILLSNFLNQTGYNPMFVNLPNIYAPGRISQPWQGTQENDSGIYRDVFKAANNGGVAPEGRFKLPPGADSAIIIFNYSAEIQSMQGKATDGNSYLQFNNTVSVTSGNATFEQMGGSSGTISMNCALAMAHEASADTSKYPIGRMRVQSRPAKMGLLKATSPGAEIVVYANGGLKRFKNGYPIVSAGRMCIWPYNSQAANASALEASVIAQSDGVEDEIPDLTSDEVLTDQSQYLKGLFKTYIEAADLTLRFDEEFDTEFPPTGVPATEPRTIVSDSLKRLLNLKRDTTKNYETMLAAVELEEQILLPYIGFKFQWDNSSAPTSLL